MWLANCTFVWLCQSIEIIQFHLSEHLSSWSGCSGRKRKRVRGWMARHFLSFSMKRNTNGKGSWVEKRARELKTYICAARSIDAERQSYGKAWRRTELSSLFIRGVQLVDTIVSLAIFLFIMYTRLVTPYVYPLLGVSYFFFSSFIYVIFIVFLSSWLSGTHIAFKWERPLYNTTCSWKLTGW